MSYSSNNHIEPMAYSSAALQDKPRLMWNVERRLLCLEPTAC